MTWFTTRTFPRRLTVVSAAVFLLLADLPAAVSAASSLPRRTPDRICVTDLGSLSSASATGAVAINDRGDVTGTAWFGSRDATESSFVRIRSGALQDIGTLGGENTDAVDINNSRVVVGRAQTADYTWHAFRWTPRGGMQDLGVDASLNSVATDINDRGEITGYASDYATGASYAFVWTPRRGLRELGNLGGTKTYARAINRLGQVIGVRTNPRGETHAFLWSARTGMRDLGVLNGWLGTWATGLNDRGDVVGFAQAGESDYHGFVWTPRVGMRDLGAGGTAYAVNNRDEVVGSSTALGGYYIWSPTAGFRAIGNPPENLYEGPLINNHDQIIGTMYTGHFQAVRWTRGGGWVELDTFGGDQSRARAINQRGEIAGWAGTADGSVHAALWRTCHTRR